MKIKLKYLTLLNPVQTGPQKMQLSMFSSDPRHRSSPNAACMAEMYLDTSNQIAIIREDSNGAVHMMGLANVQDCVVWEDKAQEVWAELTAIEVEITRSMIGAEVGSAVSNAIDARANENPQEETPKRHRRTRAQILADSQPDRSASRTS